MPPGSVAAPAATDRLRRDNTALVLRSLRDGGPASRAELAQRTGLAKATVGAIVTGLAGVGAVREDEPSPGGRTGRPGRPVALDGAASVGLGLEANVDYLAATALDLSGRVVLSTQVPTPDGHAPSVDTLVRLARDSIDTLRRDGRTLLGTTVAVPGQVDRGSGRVLDAPNLHWHDVDVVGALSDVTSGRPVWLDNDANCAAAAESAFGAARGVDDLLYLTGTVGVGAGLLTRGSVQRGAHGLAGEVGHAPLGDPSRPCACGRHGCWETAVGLSGLLRETGLAAAQVEGLDPVSIAELVARRCPDDPGVRAGVERVCRSLATGLTVLAATLDPEVIVLGGFFVPLGEWVLPAVREHVARGSASRVELSTLGLHAASTGGAADVLGQVFAGRLTVA